MRTRTEIPLRICPEVLEILKEMRDAYEVYRMLQAEPLMWPRTSYAGTKTGRISSLGSNLGNLPKPYPIDFEQLELRTFAALHLDERDHVDSLAFAIAAGKYAKTKTS